MSNNVEPVTVVPYSPEYQEQWDNYVEQSRNGVFLFYRNYMEYHSDRFKDHSLMFYRKSHLAGLFPANITDGSLQSHGGLTFGGVIVGNNTKTLAMLKIFEALASYCKTLGLNSIFLQACTLHLPFPSCKRGPLCAFPLQRQTCSPKRFLHNLPPRQPPI